MEVEECITNFDGKIPLGRLRGTLNDSIELDVWKGIVS
jgi:hypothetical protein